MRLYLKSRTRPPSAQSLGQVERSLRRPENVLTAAGRLPQGQPDEGAAVQEGVV